MSLQTNKTSATPKGANMNTLKAFYISQINEATTEDELNYLIEDASEKIEDNADYCELYDMAYNKLLTL